MLLFLGIFTRLPRHLFSALGQKVGYGSGVKVKVLERRLFGPNCHSISRFCDFRPNGAFGHFWPFFRPFGLPFWVKRCQKWPKAASRHLFGHQAVSGTLLAFLAILVKKVSWRQGKMHFFQSVGPTAFLAKGPKRCRGKVIFWGLFFEGSKNHLQKIGGLDFFYQGTFFLALGKIDPSTSPKSRTFFLGENFRPFLGQKWGVTLGCSFGFFQVDRGSGFWPFWALFGRPFWPKSVGVSLVTFFGFFAFFCPTPVFFVADEKFRVSTAH